MLGYALRRAIWAIPTLFGVSLVVFLLTTLLPDPTPDGGGSASDVGFRLRTDELRRARFLDLPRFLNTDPHDVRARVEDCVAHVVLEDDDAQLCEKRLSQIGGAGLPYLLPRLDNLPPTARGRIAVALAPIALRMGVAEERELTDPGAAALFWERFWEDRSVDFTAPAVRRSVNRLVARGTDLREEELRVVDTFALEQLVEAMRLTKDTKALIRLTRLASHVTGRDVSVKTGDDPKRVRAVVSDWLSWWYVHESDYVFLQGGAKVTASIAQTRYAKWVLGAATGQLGLSTRDGQPVFDKLLASAPVTLGMALLALLLSATIAIPLGVIAAWRRGHFVDHATALLLLAFYSLPTFLVAELLTTFGRAADAGVVLPVVALATVSLSIMTQQQRASMIEALGEDYIRTARAKGARTLRITVIHALRNALVPTVTLAGVQFPALVGAAFVVEEVFGIRGMGWETLRAIESRDAAWIVAVTLLCAVVTTACLVTSDVAYGLLDPRVREQQNPSEAHHVTEPPDDPNGESIPLLLARSSRRVPASGPGAEPAPTTGPAPKPRSSMRAPSARADKTGTMGHLRTRLGGVGMLVGMMLVMVAIFADMLASDFPIACKLHGKTWLFPNVTQPAELVALGAEAVDADAEWKIPTVVSHGPSSSTAAPLLPPGAVKGHPFGTDREGHDVFARVVHGTRTYLVFALAAVLTSLFFGGLFGSLAGLFGGATDALVGRAIETVSAFPPLVLVLGIQAAVPKATVATLFLAIALTRWPEVARLVRAEVMQVATRDYVMAARALGASPLRVLRRHIAPNVRGQLAVLGAVGVPAVILIEASLDFLRVGGPLGTASWGETMSEFRDAPGAWWLLAFPGVFLFATIVALNLVGEARRESFDPRAR